EVDAEGGSPRLPALHMDASAELPHILLRLISADSHARSFRRLERLEQPVADELLAHSASGIGDFDHRRAILPQKLDYHIALRGRRVNGILDQVADHALEARAVGDHAHRAVSHLESWSRLQARTCSDYLPQQLLERDRLRSFQSIAAT